MKKINQNFSPKSLAVRLDKKKLEIVKTNTLDEIVLKRNQMPKEPGCYATAIFDNQVELVHVVSVKGTKTLFYHYGDEIKLNLNFFPNAWWSKKLTFKLI